MANVQEHTILLVSNDAVLCAAARRELESKATGIRVAAVNTIDAVSRVLEDAAPAVILFEESAMCSGTEKPMRKPGDLNSAVSSLAVFAPVVVIGAEAQEIELAALIAAGAADFVPRGSNSVPVALGLLERRVAQSRQIEAKGQYLAEKAASQTGERFGEVLRHELNNPLTGILGNAELLLAELRRKNDGRLPQGGQQRLETIAGLAVRLRETVRRLSQDWETHHSA